MARVRVMPGLPVHHEPDRRETAYLEKWAGRDRSWRRTVMVIIVWRIKFAMHVRRYK